jgi:DNA-binding CsgD family transcriptional regulator
MSHDKIRAAARERIAETGEPYATARREVIKDYQHAGAGPGAASSSDARFFAIDYSDMGRVSLRTETRHGGGPGRGGVEVDPNVLRVRMAGFHLDIPRSAVRSAARSARSVRGTMGVHGRRGRWLVNGSYNGLVEAERRANHRTAAREPLEEGLALAHQCGARALQDRALAELLAAGARPRRPPASGRDSLTPSELRIAGLAGEGQTNRQIAQRLFITQKTVETHLSHAFRKLHIESRAQIPAALAR